MGLFSTSRCQLCSSPLRRTYYTWTTSQGRVKVCPKCNSRLESQKSREVFDPSKPFVFPPIQKASQLSGCGCLAVGGFVALVIIGVSGTRNQIVSAPTAPEAAPSSHAASVNAPPPPPAPSPSPAQVSQVSPQPQPTVELNDITHFPATIILKQRLDVKTDSGGFGLNAGEEVVVLRKQNGTYIIQHQDKEYSISADILDTIMQSK
jgi:hypothetical protein